MLRNTRVRRFITEIAWQKKVRYVRTGQDQGNLPRAPLDMEYGQDQDQLPRAPLDMEYVNKRNHRAQSTEESTNSHSVMTLSLN